MWILIHVILKQSMNNKMVSKLEVGMSTTNIISTINSKFVVICKNAGFE